MGLGKTVEILALISSNPYDEQIAKARLPYEASARLRLSKASLVVVPQALLQQWRDEICKVVVMGKLTVGVWLHSATRQGVLNPRELSVTVAAADIKGITLKLGASQQAIFIASLSSKARALDHGQLHLYDCAQVNDHVIQIGDQKVEKLFAKVGDKVAPKSGAGKDARRQWYETVLAEARQLLTDAIARKAPITLKLGRPPLNLQQLADCDIVLTTYEMLKATHGSYGVQRLKDIMWWRVVLDESQKIASDSKSRVFADAIRQITELPRVHSWLVSGTPVSGMVRSCAQTRLSQ